MRTKWILSLVAAFCLLCFSLWFAIPWAADVSTKLPAVYVWWVILGIALLPGFLMFAMFFSNVQHQKPASYPIASDPVTILLCAHNEEAALPSCLQHIFAQQYGGSISLLLIDNASTDQTAAIAKKAAAQAPPGFSVTYLFCPQKGKHFALNEGLRHVKTKLFLTLDADTLLEPEAVEQIVSCLLATDSACTAGHLFVANPRQSFVSAMQLYDYWLSIAAVKRFQGSYRTTLVAQGSFSAYRTEAVREVGGWDASFGEDIVLTYRLLSKGYGSTYAPKAAASTIVPTTWSSLFRQRKRWAYGMLEGLCTVPLLQQPSWYSRYFVLVNCLIPVLDLAYLTGFLPGVVLWGLGYPYFVGLYTLFSLLLGALLWTAAYGFQKKLNLPFQNHAIGFLGFLLFFQTISSMAAVSGYLQFLLSRRNMHW